MARVAGFNKGEKGDVIRSPTRSPLARLAGAAVVVDFLFPALGVAQRRQAEDRDAGRARPSGGERCCWVWVSRRCRLADDLAVAALSGAF